MNGYYITGDGKKETIHTSISMEYRLDYKNINNLVLPANGNILYCYRNNIKELYIKDGYRMVFCWDNPNLETIRLPASLEVLCCDMKLIEKYYDQWKNLTCNITNAKHGTYYSLPIAWFNIGLLNKLTDNIYHEI